VTATVRAIDGREFTATNQCRVSAPCPREHLPTGVGYELCNPEHAEVRAVRLAGEAAIGATLYLEGHTYACEPCKAAARDAGIIQIVVLEAEGMTP
jgi:pyrimidine deaminase RibD-like protein